mgnify:CR=1 FL=1
MLSLFLVVLLTLRGLLGDAMAMGSLPPIGIQDHAHAASTAPPHMGHGATGHGSGADQAPATAAHDGHHTAHAAALPATQPSAAPDHAHQSRQAALTSPDICSAASASDASSAGGCEHAAGTPCSACGICHSAFSLPALQAPAAHALPHIPPASGSSRYASALPQQVAKPPIS